MIQGVLFHEAPYVYGFIAMNTTSIRSDTNCAIPTQLSATSPDTGPVTISATSVDGCSLKAMLDPENADKPYGVVSVPNCGVNASNPAFDPVRQSPLFFPVGCIGMFITSRFSSGLLNKLQRAMPAFSANLACNFSMWQYTCISTIAPW
jgi:hypothetical protein